MKEAESPVHCSQKGSHDVRHVIPFLFLAFLCLTSNKHTKSKLSLFKFFQYFPDEIEITVHKYYTYKCHIQKKVMKNSQE